MQDGLQSPSWAVIAQIQFELALHALSVIYTQRFIFRMSVYHLPEVHPLTGVNCPKLDEIVRFAT